MNPLSGPWLHTYQIRITCLVQGCTLSKHESNVSRQRSYTHQTRSKCLVQRLVTHQTKIKALVEGHTLINQEASALSTVTHSPNENPVPCPRSCSHQIRIKCLVQGYRMPKQVSSALSKVARSANMNQVPCPRPHSH